MKTINFISDSFASDDDYTKGVGGAEKSDAALIERLEKDFIVKRIEASKVTNEDFKDTFSILSNCTRLKSHFTDEMDHPSPGTYLIIHHDYQFIHTRNPYQPQSMVIQPMVSLMAKAKANLFQTDFHLRVTSKVWSDIADIGMLSNPISLKCTFFSNHELITLRTKYVPTDSYRRGHTFLIPNNPNPLKGAKEASIFAEKMGLKYSLIQPMNYLDFLTNLSTAAGIVFTPLTPETCCRLVLESKCIGTPVITNADFGCTLQDYYMLSGLDLIKRIEEINDTSYIKIRDLINE